MLMLSAYMDETGHSRDEAVRFNGIAGLFAPSDAWENFERKWLETLKEFKVPAIKGNKNPYFHMREFAHSTGTFEGWKGKETKRRKLFGKLLRHIANVHPLIIGSIIPLTTWRNLTEAQQRLLHGDPYFLSFQNAITYCTSYLEIVKASPDIKVAMIFSDQVEFKYRALGLYDEIYKFGRFIKRNAKPPSFEDMRELVPLQAADIVAYEMYKEADRRMYRPHDEARYGYKELEKMNLRHGYTMMCRFYTESELLDYLRDAERAARINAYWKKKRAKK